ncbi:MAG: HAD family hydrolase [Oscillospiraceae bacterium]|nr:HAD family hydrolase [Oscillospiraceae bacterium]
MSKSAAKWNGVKAALETLNIPQAEAVYFGDDNDDIEPIQMCGMGIAVSNAIEAVTDAAGYITGSNDEDGVAHFIEANLL